jgi:hypothetical protein
VSIYQQYITECDGFRKAGTNPSFQLVTNLGVRTAVYWEVMLCSLLRLCSITTKQTEVFIYTTVETIISYSLGVMTHNLKNVISESV